MVGAPDLAGDRYDTLYLPNYALLARQGRAGAARGVGDVQIFGSGDYSMRVWLDPEKVASRGLTAERCGAAHPRAEHPGGRRPARRAAGSPSAAELPARHQHQGPPDQRGGLPQHHRQDRRRGPGDAPARRGARRARLGIRAARVARQQAPRWRFRSSSARAQRDRRSPKQRARQDGGAEERLPAGHRLQHRLRPDGVRARLDRGGGPHAARSDRCWW